MEQIKNDITWYYLFGIRREVSEFDDTIIQSMDGLFVYTSEDIKNINFLYQDKLIKDIKGEKWNIKDYDYPNEWIKAYYKYNSALNMMKLRQLHNPITYHLINYIEKLDDKIIENLARTMDYKKRNESIFKL